jgi:hypothetical protein
MSLIPGTIPQLLKPYPTLNEGVTRFSKPAPVQVFRNPEYKVNTMTRVPIIRNQQPAPATRPTYGYVRPGAF